MLTIYLGMLDTENEKQTFKKIYIKYKDRAIKIAYHILNDNHYAEEALNDAFVAIAKTINSLPQDDELHERNYIYKVVKNAAIRILKTNVQNTSIDVYADADKLSDYQSPIDELIEQENVGRILNYIKTMPGNYRDILMMRYFHGMSYIDISTSLNINLNTVRTKLKRGTAMLQEQIEMGGKR